MHFIGLSVTCKKVVNKCPIEQGNDLENTNDCIWDYP